MYGNLLAKIATVLPLPLSLPLSPFGHALQKRRQIKQNRMRHLQHLIEWQRQELQLQLQLHCQMLP